MPGVIVWEGPSRIDGSPVVVIATWGSENRKTGPMVQTWILRSDVDPVSAVREGLDRSVCGDCPLRGEGFKRRACYVNVGQAPLSIYKAFKRGSYPRGETPLGVPVRVGSYGDPGALPAWVTRELIARAGSHTGYTHQWRERPDLAGMLMASVETLDGALEAWSSGWKTFRVVGKSEKMPKNREKSCPASKGVLCATCKGCNGKSYNRIIPAHGTGKVYF